ncbi:sulfide:quinone oxidoreductase, mitochondrial [Hydra vulgaris]|nr:sulfide:quinone oxidoreductase, mitochondrial [Hydra vulgaris]
MLRLCSIQSYRSFSCSTNLQQESFKFVVIGGGTGGLSVASYLSRKFPKQVAIVEPSEVHYYQPMWTLVGAGIKDVKDTYKPMANFIPKNAKWIKEKVLQILPEENLVVTGSDKQLKYEILVVAVGLQLDFHKIQGLPESLGTDGVGCNYSINTVQDTYKALQNFKGGNAFFTVPATPVKCLGAPQKIMYLADELMRKNGVRDKACIVFKTPGPVLFAVEKYRNALLKICAERDLKIETFRNLVQIDPLVKKATFEFVDDTNSPKKREVLDYSFIHVTPPMGPVDFIKSSSIVDSTGFVNVNKNTLQHVKYNNIFALGDCSNLPTSKTAAAVAAQSEVVRKNIRSLVKGEPLKSVYTGYTSCPLVTSSKTCILAEFDYSGLPRETFPFDQSKERYSMYIMKANAMPFLYWNSLIKGTWGGPEKIRKLLHFGFV